jgi:hypothetical protein
MRHRSHPRTIQTLHVPVHLPEHRQRIMWLRRVMITTTVITQARRRTQQRHPVHLHTRRLHDAISRAGAIKKSKSTLYRIAALTSSSVVGDAFYKTNAVSTHPQRFARGERRKSGAATDAL